MICSEIDRDVEANILTSIGLRGITSHHSEKKSGFSILAFTLFSLFCIYLNKIMQEDYEKQTFIYLAKSMQVSKKMADQQEPIYIHNKQ